MLYSRDDYFTVCDFGASDGGTLKEIGTRFPNAKLVGIELNLQSLISSGIEAYSSIIDAFNSVSIDLLISSNSFLYTDYNELQLVLNGNTRPNSLILTGPNHINRIAQMFYDDVVCNASPNGLKCMVENYGYHEMIVDHKLSNPNEFTIVCTLCSSNDPQLNVPIESFDLPRKKKDLLMLYSNQYNNECQDRTIYIFGTSIDSAILSTFHRDKIVFVKDNPKYRELFMGFPVVEPKYVSQKIIVPSLMTNSDFLNKRLNY